MEQQNPTVPLNERPEGTGDASHVPQPSGINAPPPRPEEGAGEHFAGQAPRWEDQWLDLLDRVRLEHVLEDEALWGEAQVLLAFLEPEPEACWRAGHEWAYRHEALQTLAVLPQEWLSWLGERGLQDRSQVVALAGAFLWRWHASWRRRNRVAAGSSSSTVQGNPPDPRQSSTVQENQPDPRQSSAVQENPPDLRQSSAVQENPPDPRQEADGQQSRWGSGTLSTWEMRYLCSMCGKRFSRSSQLTLHEKLHRGEKPYQCAECGQSFARRHHLTSHKRIHTGEKPYQCSICENSFRCQGTLQQHKRIHTGEKPYKCSLCGKSFSRRYRLTSHQRTHTGEKPFKCPECSESFADNSTYRKHLRIHTGDKPFQCRVCRKTFRHIDTLHQHHQRVHIGEKPYKCSQCEKSFSVRKSLTRHQATHPSPEDADQSPMQELE